MWTKTKPSPNKNKKYVESNERVEGRKIINLWSKLKCLLLYIIFIWIFLSGVLRTFIHWPYLFVLLCGELIMWNFWHVWIINMIFVCIDSSYVWQFLLVINHVWNLNLWRYIALYTTEPKIYMVYCMPNLQKNILDNSDIK